MRILPKLLRVGRPFFLLLVILAPGALSAAPALSLDAKGIVIDAGATGRFTLLAPTLVLADKQELKPQVEIEARAIRYSNGAAIRVSIDGGAITCALMGVSAGARSLKFVMTVPMNFNQGGRYAFSGAPLRDIPAERAGQFVEQGTADRFDLISPLGGGLTFVVSPGWSGLQDNRQWNWNAYSWCYFYDLLRHGTGDFTLRVGDYAPPSSSAPQASGSADARAVEPRRLLDRFGQAWAKNYPGKVTSEDELRSDVQAEDAWLASFEIPAQAAFGGMPGSAEKFGLKATGFFRLDKVKGRDVFVTPEGDLFFQLGICGFQPSDDYTYVKGREAAYEWLPPRNGEFATAWRPGDPSSVSFYVANWIRKYQRPFDAEVWAEQAIRRARVWGFNSSGAFSRPTALNRRERFPFTLGLPLGKAGLRMLPKCEPIMDPFDPKVAEKLDKAFSAHLRPEAENPLLIGYFIGNEELFENVPKVVPTLKADTPAKRRLVQLLRERHKDDIEAFNRAWQPVEPVASFDALGDASLFVTTRAAQEDMGAYFELFVDAYYGAIAETFRRHDPNHLLLGGRWQPGTANNEILVRAAARHTDVISVNYYTYALERTLLDRVHRWSGDRPMLLGEWYYACTDEGLGGGFELANQRERGLAYRNYVENAAALPYVVGQQWFIFIDQSITGRFFQKYTGEGNNTGLVNVVDRPYRAFLEEAAKTNRRVYDVLLGRAEPFHFEDPRFAANAQGGGNRVAIPRATAGMKVDGIMDDWPGRPGMPLGRRNLVMGKDAEGLEADFRLCWDEARLYLFAQVKDSSPMMNTQPPAKLWRADGLELFIGGENPDRAGALLFNDRQILVGGSLPPRFHMSGAETQPDIQVAVTAAVGGGGYAVEVGIPWTALDIKPASGREFLFDLGVDDSVDGETRLRQLMWNGTSRNSSDRGAWGRARLTDN